MDPERLLRDELVYELRLRGYDNLEGETVRSMRRQLGDLLRTEGFGAARALPPGIELNVVEEIEVCTTKIEDLEKYLLTYRGLHRSDMRHVETKLKHLYGRLERLKLGEAEEDRPTGRAIGNLKARLGAMEVKVDQLDEEARGVEPIAAAVAAEAAPDVGEVPNAAARVINIHKRQYEPRKWGIKFDGGDTLSVAAFLEQVEDKRRSSHLTEAELLASVSDLLEGSAAILYRAKAHQIDSWVAFQRFL